MSKYRNVKIAIPEENREEISKQVQEALFSKGVMWSEGGTEVDRTEGAYLYVDEDNELSYGEKYDVFELSNKKEISYKEIMPKLEAGKHIVVDEDGYKYLYLSDDLCLRFAGDRWPDLRGGTWSPMRLISIKSIHEIYLSGNRSHCEANADNLIWAKEKTREQKLREIIENAQKELDAL